jgi:hypothetical protein
MGLAIDNKCKKALGEPTNPREAELRAQIPKGTVRCGYHGCKEVLHKGEMLTYYNGQLFCGTPDEFMSCAYREMQLHEE